MPRKEIEKYRAAWKPETREGRLRLLLEDDTQESFSFGEATDFLAVLEVLKQGPRVFLDDDGWVSTGPESPS